MKFLLRLSLAAVLATLVGAAWRPAAAEAQTSSLISPQQRSAATLSEMSWTYQKLDGAPTLRLHDLITVAVSEKSVMQSNGKMDRNKTGYGDLSLPDWILLKGLRKVVEDPQSADSGGTSPPHIRGQIDNKLQSKGDLQTEDLIAFHITCEVVDIRPNGNVVIEGHSTIKNNEDMWDYSLSGEVRPASILPNNTLTSENIAGLRIVKQESGYVRDSYRRGWLLQWLDKWQPF